MKKEVTPKNLFDDKFFDLSSKKMNLRMNKLRKEYQQFLDAKKRGFSAFDDQPRPKLFNV